MRKTQRQQADELIRQLEEAHDKLKNYLDQKQVRFAMELLKDCQGNGISIGTLVEKTEGEGHKTVSLLEEYCELTYQIHEKLANGTEQNPNKSYKLLKQKLIEISNSLNRDITIRIEAVFLPYKASMWDSLESVWREADTDPCCDAYVIPIPYFDRNPDGSFGEMHDEADCYPADIPVTKYDEFNFEEHHPDMIFIHNPYDNANFVTSVHPFFYSKNLKQYTDCLVYIPYYTSTGGMSEGQSLCSAYIYADYIVIQAEKYRKFFDERIPDEKFLALGSPKFDRVIQKCKNPPKPPDEWIGRMAGRKVYFYNTSITGMLGDTEIFLKKVRYVFDIFKERDDVCLLWRPHPLMDATFTSMRSRYKPQYDALKREFLEENIGILDETPDIEKTIALSDVYVGDDATSVTSLFGVSGKPLFIFNNYINTLPEEDDWRGEWILPQFDPYGNDKYMITKNNQLWVSPENDYHYHFYMDLGCEYSGGAYYMKAIEIGNRIFVLPCNARHFLVIEDQKIRRIELEEDLNAYAGAFWNYVYTEKYIFLFPFRYPYLVRITIETEQVCCLDGIRQFHIRNVDGSWLMGGGALYGNELVFASPVDSRFAFVDMDTLEVRILDSGAKCNLGARWIVPDGDELWLLPGKGLTITCWNPKSGGITEYSGLPQEFSAVKWPGEIKCDEYPYGNLRISRKQGRETIVLSPYWGNMYLSLDRATGKLEEWKPPIELKRNGKNGYFLSGTMGGFLNGLPQGSPVQLIWNTSERKLYEVNIDTKEWKEIEIVIDREELAAQEPGFAKKSEWMQYCLEESAFNSLKDLLDDDITGSRFDREKQTAAFSRINADSEGTCGRNVYRCMKGKVL